MGDRVGEFTSQYSPDDYSDPKMVPLRYDPENGPEFGKITGVLSDGKIVIEWDTDWRNRDGCQYVKPQDPNEFAPEDVVKARYFKLEAECR